MMGTEFRFSKQNFEFEQMDMSGGLPDDQLSSRPSISRNAL